jgi:carbonic anhydrase
MPLRHLLEHNRTWASQMEAVRPGFFTALSQQQTPRYMWIGCSDSRVPADIIVNALPGAIFAHRNIANQVICTDFNCLSVIQYAVQVLKVPHVIVCGHYNCGGVRAALDRQRPELSLLNKWLMHIKDIYRMHREEIDALNSQTERADRLVEINVIEQVMRLSQFSIVQTAWKEDQRPMLHGWVFGLDDGILHELITLPPGSDVDVIYQQHGGDF